MIKSARTVKIGNVKVNVPKNRFVRIAVGLAFVVAGIFGFLPILGYWMVPVGLVILSVDSAYVRRFRRKLDVLVLRRVKLYAPVYRPFFAKLSALWQKFTGIFRKKQG